MSDVPRHCPFLNRADERCASHFNIDGLGHAYRFCFDRYKTCPVYIQLLIERRVRRADAAATEKSREPTPAPAPLAVATAPIIEVTISAGPGINSAAAPGLPASPGV